MPSHFSRTFGKLLADHREKLVRDLAGGHAESYAVYRQIVGRLEGLDDSLKILEEADTMINGDMNAGA